MTELMKRYEAETGKSSTQTITDGLDIWHYEYIAWLEAKVLDGETVEKFQEIIRNQCDEISALKAQLTWRPVSEKPEKDGEYLVKGSGFFEVLKYEKDKWYGWDVEVCEWFIEILYGDEEWLPIPPAPEGE